MANITALTKGTPEFEEMVRTAFANPVNLNEFNDNLWLEIGDVRELKLQNRMLAPEWDDPRKTPELIVELCRDPDYLHFYVKYVLKIDLLPQQVVILQTFWNKSFPMYIASRGAGKSFLFAVYTIVRMTMSQGAKVVVVGASLRQSMVIYNYIQQIWENAPILRDICGNEPPKRDIHVAYWKCGNSRAVFLPLADGSKIRGQRANIIIADEFACLDKNTLVETDNGLQRIADTFDKSDFKLFTGKSTNLEKPERYIKTPLTDVYEIQTKYGYTFKCSSIHQVHTSNGFKLAKDLTPNDYLTFENHYLFPSKLVERDGVTLNENLAWFMGILMSEGFMERVYHQLDPDICQQLSNFGLPLSIAHDKKIPWSILQSPKRVVVAFLSGLFEGDGSAFHFSSQGRDNHLGINYCSVSEQLCQEVQIVLSKLDLISLRQNHINQWTVRLNGDYAYRLGRLLNIPKWNKIISEPYINHAPRDEHNGKCLQVRAVKKLERLDHLYDYHLPQSHTFMAGGFRQHNSIPKEVFETVVRGFAAVKTEGLFDNVVQSYREQAGKILDQDNPEKEPEELPKGLRSNQILLGGTAYYQFNHFYKYFAYYRAIILTGGDKKLLRKEFPDMPVPSEIDSREYAIIRLPYDALPHNMMDQSILNQGRATMDPQIFDMEYGACFPSDSDGFYLASWLHRATCPVLVEGAKFPIDFKPRLFGEKGKKYVMGVDPASEDDNFAINIMENNGNYRSVVYQWSTNRKKFEELKRDKNGDLPSTINDYNTFVVTHIRDLLRRFDIEMIVMDAAGGGGSVRESLRDPAKLLDQNDELIYDMDDETVTRAKGRHILKLIQFSNQAWRVEAHHGLRKDIMEMRVIFPSYDTAEVAVASFNSSRIGSVFDTLEDCYLELEQCKQETTLIRRGQTLTGQEKWDVPKITGIDSEQIRKTLKKDRFTSLLLANWGFRLIMANSYTQPTEIFGGSVTDLSGHQVGGPMFIGKGASRLKNMAEYSLHQTNSQDVRFSPGRKIFY